MSESDKSIAHGLKPEVIRARFHAERLKIIAYGIVAEEETGMDLVGQMKQTASFVSEYGGDEFDHILLKDLQLNVKFSQVQDKGFWGYLKRLVFRVKIALLSRQVETVISRFIKNICLHEGQTQVRTKEAGAKILRFFVPVEIQSDLIGDIEEEFILVTERHGEKYAKRWFWWQVTWTSARYFIASAIGAFTGKTGSK